MNDNGSIDRWRVRARAARMVVFAVVPVACVAGLCSLLDRVPRYEGRHFLFDLFACCVTTTLSFAVFATGYDGAGRPGWPGRTPISRAPLGSQVAVGGRVARASGGEDLRAPISGSPCVYYHVRLAWSPSRDLTPWSERFGERRWIPLYRFQRLVRFVVVDESGSVLLDPGAEVEALPDDTDDRRVEVVHVDFSLSKRVTIYESAAGGLGLPPVAQTYLETLKERLPDHFRAWHLEEVRIRLTEVTIREGDTVSVAGTMEERHEPAAYRDSRSRAMRQPFEVELMGPDELAWLVGFHRRIVALFTVVSVAGGLATAYGLVSFVISHRR